MKRSTRDKELFNRWGIYYDNECDKWTVDTVVKCSFSDMPITRGFVVIAKDKVIGVSSIEHMPTLMDDIFGDKKIEFIRMIAFESKKHKSETA